MALRGAFLDQPNNIQAPENDAAAKGLRQLGKVDEAIEHLINSPQEYQHLLGSTMRGSAGGKILHQLGPISKLLEVAELKDHYDEGVERGHSAFAAYLGAGAGMAAGGVTFTAGAGLVAAGVLAAPEAPPVGVAAVTAGALLMHKSEEVAHKARHDVPIIVDATLDKFGDLYTSAVQFVQQAYSKYFAGEDLSSRQYADIESAMIDLGYKQHVESFYSDLDRNQQLLYGVIVRDLFKEQFSLNGVRLQCGGLVASPGTKANIEKSGLKQDIVKIQTKLKREAELLEKKGDGQLNKTIKGHQQELKSELTKLVGIANRQKISAPAAGAVKAQDCIVRNAYQFCEMYNTTAQGVALLAHIGGNHRVANQIAASAMGVSQVVMGVAQIAQNGLSFGPVGMVFGGINALINCFGASDGDSGMSAIAEQLAIISSQIHALHEDMLLQFSRVFTALGIINTNIIEGFKLLHEDQERILINVMKLQKSVSALQDSVNIVGKKIDDLGADLRGYVLEDDRKQLLFILNGVKEKIRRDFDRVSMQTEVMTALKTYNEALVQRQLSDVGVTSAEITKSLTTKLGSAEANTGLLLNYAKTRLDIAVTLPIADPESWRQCADVLIQMTDIISSKQRGRDVIGVQDYEDFKHLKEIGDHWLAVIEQFKTAPDRANKLALLFQQYRTQVQNLITLIEQEIKVSEQETKDKLKPKCHGLDDFEKQKKFNYEFKRNYAYVTLTEDASRCKGFHNGPRAMGYDSFYNEWAAHLEARKKDISERIGNCGNELGNHFAYHASDSIQYYKSEKSRLNWYAPWHTAAAFMVSESSPDIMPLLPLPCSILGLTPVGKNPPSTRQIPLAFIEAELLGLGTIRHTYKFENNEFVYKIQFQMPGEAQAIIIVQYNKACTLAGHLNPAEAVWHAYMGGAYPANASYSHLRAGAVNWNVNGDYWSRQHCAIPSMTTEDGLRKTLELSAETPKVKAAKSIEDMIEKRVKEKKAALRQTMNERILQNLESLDSRNALAMALLEVDASAKVLIAFLSILFRENYQRPTAVWTRDDIIDYVKNYRNQEIYLSHQLETNLDVLQTHERILLERINLQTESAYTPVSETLRKLAQFMEMYEARVVDDDVLAARARVERNREAAQFGAAQAALVLQGELIISGHIDAALHISRLLTRNGLGVLSITTTDETNRAISSLGSQGFFAIAGPAVAAANDEVKQNDIHPGGPK